MKEIDIYITAIAAEYSFKMDENTPLRLLADEAAAIVCQKEQCEQPPDDAEPIFYSISRKAILDSSKTLRELSVNSGDKLYLV